MKQTLSVSVVVLLQNEKNFLEDALYSIQKQNYQPIEIIVIDINVEGLVSELITQCLTLHYYHRPGHNKATSRNFGIHLAYGEVIAFLDAGDMWTDHKLADQINYLEAHPEAEIVQGLIQNVSGAAQYLSLVECPNSTYEFVNSGSLVYRRSVFETVGMFDETLNIGEELDWFLRAWEKDIVKARFTQIALLHRVSDLRESQASIKSFQVQSLKVIKKQLIRQKKETERFARNQRNLLINYIGNPYGELHTDLEPFTIIADDCWSYGPYGELKIQYSTPFIGIRIEPSCFLELLKNPQEYLEAPLLFANHSRYERINQWRNKDKLNFPIAQLKNRVELLFVHETDQDICRKKWERRIKRINWNNLFIKFRHDAWDFCDAYFNEFDRLKYKNKVCFTLKEYPEFDWAIHIPGYFEAIYEKGNIYDVTKPYFDAVSWVKKTYGSDTSAYKVKKISCDGP